MSYLLDTNVVSEWTRPRPNPRVVAWLADVDEDRVFVSVITLAELRRGVELHTGHKERIGFQGAGVQVLNLWTEAAAETDT